MAEEQKTRLQKNFQYESGRLFSFIRSKIRSLEESEDMLQEVYVQALNELNVLSSIDNLSGWLYTVAKNKIIDWYRKKRLPMASIHESKENGFTFNDFLTEEIPDTLDADTSAVMQEAIMEAIDQLPPKQKYVFIQQVIEEKTFRELAQETGESINTLIARKRYAIQFLRNTLSEFKKLL